jgi:hypothetical protein
MNNPLLYFCYICVYKSRLALYAQIRQKYQTWIIINRKLTVPTSEGLVLFFFDTFLILGHLFLYFRKYNFKNLYLHFPEILIPKFMSFQYCIGLFAIIFGISVKFLF